MALPSSGQLSMSDINTELGNSSTAQITLNDTNVRTLLQRTSAQTEIGMNAGYSKYYEPNPRAFVQFYSFIMNNYVISGYPSGGYLHKYIKVDKDTFTATDIGNIAGLGNYSGADFPVTGYSPFVDGENWLSVPGSNMGLIFGGDSGGSGNTFLIKITPTDASMTTIRSGGYPDGTYYPYAAGYGPAGYIYTSLRANYLGGQRYVNISPNLTNWTQTQVSYGLFNYVGTPNAYTAVAATTGAWILQSSTNGTTWISRLNLSLMGIRAGGLAGTYGAGSIVYAHCYMTYSTMYIYRSTNDGVSWSTNTINLPENPNGNTERPRIVYAGNGTFVLFVSATSAMTDWYVYRSTDKGISWSYTKYTNFLAGVGYAANYAAFSTTDGNIIFICGGTYKQSTDFGVTWITKTIPQKFTPGNRTVGIIFPIF